LAESVALTVNGTACATVSGVPEIVTEFKPLGVSCRLCGSAPELIVQRKGATPPLACTFWL
jgi:hypothetical protein